MIDHIGGILTKLGLAMVLREALSQYRAKIALLLYEQVTSQPQANGA